MKTLKSFLFSFLCVMVQTQVMGDDAALHAPGSIFIRQHAADLKLYRDTFLGQKDNLKAQGFEAYSFHQALEDPHTVIVTLKCSDLKKGVDFVRSPGFMSVMDKAQVGLPVVWYGLDLAKWKTLQLTQRQYANRPKMTGGIVIARNEVRDYFFWLDCFYKEDGGKHNHAGRQYKNSNYTIHHLPGDPAVAIVAHEASDVSKAPSFMASDAMKGEMEATGVIGLEVWYGLNVEEGIF